MDRLAYRLSNEENQRIFELAIAPAAFAALKPQEHPIAVFVGGQPGAGKTALQEAIARNVSIDFSSIAKVNGDEFRGYHPRFDELNSLDDVTAAYYTDADAGAWVERGIEFASSRRAHLLVEGTLRNPAVTIGSARGLVACGYQCELHVVAANGFYSRLRIFSRYLGQRKVDGYGRYTLLSAHDASYDVLPQSLDEILASGLFTRLVLYDIERNVLFDSALDRRDASEAALAILGLVRSRTHQPLERLLSDAQGMRRLAMELNCSDVVMDDIGRLIDDLLTSMSEEAVH